MKETTIKVKSLKRINGEWEEVENDMTIRVGETVEFKCDIEQCSVVKDMRRNQWSGAVEVLVTVTEGGYGHGDTWIGAVDCF